LSARIASSLADTVESLLHDSIRARALGAAGRAAVLRDFNIDTVAAKTLRAFEHVVRIRAA
jgi:glycosyltransferase involved in cell wall biosynthesis